MSDRVELPGLAGDNPLGFLAALGVAGLFDAAGSGSTRLAWSDAAVPSAILHGVATPGEIADRACAMAVRLRDATAVRYAINGQPIGDVKFSEPQLHEYLEACLKADDGGLSISLASALVAEGSFDNNAQAKPTDLHFTAGQQKFVQMVRDLTESPDLDASAVERALTDSWSYSSILPSFMWDVTDDRVYALAAFNPSSDKKATEPGAELLALLGLTALPVFGGRGRTRTTGCGGSWKSGEFTWPIWRDACTFRGARSLIAHATLANEPWLGAWGVSRLYRCAIRRSDQGGYGSFAPPTEVWRAAV